MKITLTRFSLLFIVIAASSTAARAMQTDICTQIDYVIRHLPPAGGDVDETQFTGKQPCSVNPFGGLPHGHVSVRLGNVRIESTVPWQIQGGNVTLTGISPEATHLVYTGSTAIPAVLTAIAPATTNRCGGADLGDCGSVRIENLYIMGNGNGPNRLNWAHTGLFVLKCFRSQFNNVSVWGTQDFGMYVQGGVDVSLRSPRVSEWDANEVFPDLVGTPQGIIGAPQTGIQLDAFESSCDGTFATTAGTISDAAVEGVTGVGIVCAHAANMVFQAGTSENNARGVYVGPSCSGMTFIGMDIEANSDPEHIDFQDDGSNTVLINLYTQNQISLASHSTNTSIIGGNIGGGFSINPLAHGYSLQVPSRALGWLMGSSAPTGPCSPGSLFTRTDTGNLYVCQNSNWVLK